MSTLFYFLGGLLLFLVFCVICGIVISGWNSTMERNQKESKMSHPKVVIIDGKTYIPGYPQCQGCENLAVGNGWECIYKEETTECEYPESLVKAMRDDH